MVASLVASLPLGRRVALRRRLPGQTGASGGPLLTDVVGVVLAVDDSMLTLGRRDGSRVEVPCTDVVAVRLLAAAGPPRRASGEDLQRVTAHGWPASVSEPLGDWLLRAAGGFTGRANSASVHGDPGVAMDEALARVQAFYHRHGLAARAQVVVGSHWDAAFAAAGWCPLTGRGAEVLTVTIAAAIAAQPPVQPVPVHAELTPTWLSRYGRLADPDTDLAAARAVLSGGDTVGFAQVDGDPGKPPAAIGRVVVTGAWAGLACVEVDPAGRGRGLARRVVQTSLSWAKDRGARWCYVQTMPDNAAALGLYASYGFTPHSAYRYLVPPG
jgi:GNAT superfamily N-acetyltransferase